MMDEKQTQYNKPMFCEVNGLRLAYTKSIKSVEEHQSIIDHNSKQVYDLIICTIPKSGTTWLSHIVYLILNNGTPGGDGFAYNVFDYSRSDFDNNKDQLKIVLTHLPISLLPYNNGKTKLIIALRNPKDVVVSFYFFYKSRETSYNEDFHQFFKRWINGDVLYGDYFELVREKFKHRNEQNVLFVFYENLLRNTREEIVRIAGFINQKYSEKLMDNNNNNFMENVLKHCSIEDMRTQITKYPFLVRKGIIGDWRNYLTKEESDIIDNKVNEKLSETGLAEVWKNDMLWKN